MDLADESTLRVEHTDESALPTALGRFELVGQLGSGAMGVVLEARDPALDRRVAIKLLHRSLWADTTQTKARLASEAQAMAKLAHPNVVVVYEVGWLGDRAFFAMEHVEGGTLRDWQKRPRTWREIVAMYVAAGDGLAAAHAEELTHRDFKPDNVLVGRDGRPRVSDFGLAGELFEETDSEMLLTSSVSIAGRAVGTPAYMAPESWEGRCDAKGDQFSFCVSLWEAIAGRRPFGGEDLGSLRSAVANGRFEASSQLGSVPRRLELALRRGLATAPADRWPSMTSLLAELRVIASRSSRTPWIVAGGVALVAMSAGVALLARDDEVRVEEPPPSAPSAEPQFAAPVPITTMDGCAHMPAFVDDTTVAFDLSKDEVQDVYDMVLGGTPRRLTTDEGGEWAAARGPGSQVAFLASGNTKKPRIEALDRSTGSRTTIHEGSGFVAWARDAFFVTRPATNEIHRIRGTTDEVFANLGDAGVAYYIVASNDGSRLAVFGYQRGVATICVIETDTRAVTCHTDLNKAPTQPLATRMAFSSDNEAIYYASQRSVYRVPVAGGPPKQMFDAKVRGGLSVSPSGTALVYSECYTRTNVESVTRGTRELADTAWLAVSKSGAKAYVRAQRTIVLQQPDGAKRELLVLDEGAASELTFSPDGNVLVYQVGGGKHDGLYEMNVESALPNRISTEKADTGPLVVAGAIIFTRAGVNSDPHVVRVPLEGGAPRVFTERTRIALAAAPNGRVLVTTPARDRFYWWDPVKDIEHPGPNLVLDKGIKSVRMSPDGRWLVALAASNGRLIYRLRADVANARAALVRELPASLGCASATIDNDGDVLAAIERNAGELALVTAIDGTRW